MAFANRDGRQHVQEAMWSDAVSSVRRHRGVDCVVPNNVLGTKTATRIAGPLTVANAGSFTIQVRNGASGAPISNAAALTVNAR